jgi:hypothetical protein
MQRLKALDVQMLATPDQQISLTDPDARSMATSGRGSGVVGYNVQVAVDTKHHLIVTHEVTNVGNDRSQLAGVAKQTKDTLRRENLDVVADRGYFNSTEILACEEAGITVTLPKPMTSNAKADGRFGKQDFRYMAGEDLYICPAGESLTYRYTNEEHGLVLRRYWTNACPSCAIKHSCTPSKERRITRWEHEHVLEAVQRRLDEHPEKMRQRRETVEHPFGTIKARMGANPLPHEDAATRRHRNGAARAHLQSYPRHQHHGARTADRSDQDVAPAVRLSLLTRFDRSKCGQRARASRRATTAAGTSRTSDRHRPTPTAARHLATSRFRTAWVVVGKHRTEDIFSGVPHITDL